MDRIDLSIIIPAYNAEKYLARCLDSILCENELSYEIIIVDDGSNDRTTQISDQYAIDNNCISVYHQKNSGVSEARNKGISVARNQYVMFVDADDTLVESWGDSIRSIKSNADLIILNYIKCSKGRLNNDSGLNILDDRKQSVSKEQLIKLFVMTDQLNQAWAKLYRTDFLEKNEILFPKDVKIGEDAIFVGKVIEKVEKYTYVNKAILIYEDNVGSASYRKGFNFSDQQRLFLAKKELSLAGGCFSEAFYTKFLGDFFSKLKHVSLDVNDYYSVVKSLNDYDYVNEIIDFGYTSLPFRREMQRALFANKRYTLLLLELRFEKMLEVFRRSF